MAGFIGLTIAAAVAYFVVPLIGSAAVLFATSLHPKWVHLCNAVAGGVLIGVALCHMLGDNVEGMEGWGQKFNAALGGDPDESFPLGIALVGIGFFVVLGIKVLVGVDPDHIPDDDDASSQASSSQVDRENVHIAAGGEGNLTGIATWVGIGLHSTIEAIATGSAQSASAFGVLVIAVLLHKGFAGFAVGTSLQPLLKRNAALWWTFVIAFASTGPIGIAIGAIARAEVEGEASALLQCLAAGTLLAVGIGEMLLPALEGKGIWKKRQLFSAFLGFFAMGLLAVW
eukprot:CAMPEP_0179038148 /NCGR_PEP_ID=MMETSP0796-20121207/14486_1 /TAXON_ID=73915 /ORGANISM="Pyrodinium bahamense, Strain pbaha01" /LENGTH=284 /DNA_ID=CAMNT_0020734461 /DNA_START=37 /DNA_END=888 /DNA_ORIENTATION=-